MADPGIDTSLAQPLPHYCRKPDIFVVNPEWVGMENTPEGVSPRLRMYNTGTRYTCPGCGDVWIVWEKPTQRGRYAVMVGGPEWRRETRTERRQRLGIPWWRPW